METALPSDEIKLNREQRRKLKKIKKNPLDNSLRNNKSWYELITSYNSIDEMYIGLESNIKELSEIIKHETKLILIEEIVTEIKECEDRVYSSLKNVREELGKVYNKHKDIKRGLKDYDEYMDVINIYNSYQNITVKYTTDIIKDIDNIKLLLNNHVTDSKISNISFMDKEELEVKDITDFVSRTIEKDVIIPDYLKTTGEENDA